MANFFDALFGKTKSAPAAPVMQRTRLSPVMERAAQAAEVDRRDPFANQDAPEPRFRLSDEGVKGSEQMPTVSAPAGTRLVPIEGGTTVKGQEQNDGRVQLSPMMMQQDQVVAVPPTTAPIAAPMSDLERLQLEGRNLRDTKGELDPANKVVNQNHGIKGRLWDIAREGIINAGQAYNQGRANGESARDALVGSIGGGLVGGLSGGFDPSVNERRARLYDINRNAGQVAQAQQQEEFKTAQDYKQAQIQGVKDKPILAREALKAKAEAATKSAQNRLDVINRQADIKSGEAKVYTDEDGKQWKQYLKPDSSGKLREMEPIINPTTGEQDFAPGEQLADWVDPLTGNTIQVKAKQVLMPGATLATGNAQRRQDADKTNASQELEAQKTNAAAIGKYIPMLRRGAISLAQADGKTLENLGEVQGIANEMDSLNKQIEGFDLSDDEKGAKQNKYNDLLLKYGALDSKYQQALGKTDAGKRAVEALTANGIVHPQAVHAVKIQAAQVTGGVKSKVDDSAARERIKKLFPSESEAQISARLSKAKADGWVK